MIPEIGVFFLSLAFVTSMYQMLLPLLVKFGYEAPSVARASDAASAISFFSILMAFLLLVNSYVESDFSVRSVAANSHTAKPLIYKITGAWANHEGSMLLWLLVLGLFSMLFSRYQRTQDTLTHLLTLSAQATVTAGFILFVLLTSNPFERLLPPAIQGNDLNPLLQDIGLAMHPPLLYLGYVGFSLVFSHAVAALFLGRMDRDWARESRKWILFSWSMLTIGIGLGAWWAYRELGWGGWWFWDPVENASLLPWLSATALLHSNLVLEKRDMLKRWTLLLCILTFTLSVTGTFLVRSGVITSVHSFAADPSRGLYILAYLVIICGGALFLFAKNYDRFDTDAMIAPFSREGGIIANNLFLVCACLTVLLATIYPLLLQLYGRNTISIGPDYFNSTFLPLTAPLVIIAGLSGFMPWKKVNGNDLWKRISPIVLISLFAAILTLLLQPKSPFISAAGIGLGVWLVASTLYYAFTRLQPLNDLQKLITLPPATKAMIISHLGLGFLVLGITGSTLWQEQVEGTISKEKPMQVKHFKLTLSDEEIRQDHNYIARRANISVSDQRSQEDLALLSPELRRYDVRDTVTSEADIHTTPSYDLYVVPGETKQGNATSLRVYYTPLILLLWAGFALMAFGAMLGLSKPRKRTP